MGTWEVGERTDVCTRDDHYSLLYQVKRDRPKDHKKGGLQTYTELRTFSQIHNWALLKTREQ